MADNVNGTTFIHGDHDRSLKARDVAPPINVSSTYRYNHDDPSLQELTIDTCWDPEFHVYSRYTQESNTRVELILSKILDGYAATYTSGLSAAYAALVDSKPTRIAIRGGYFGCHASIKVYQKSRGNVPLIDLDDEFQPGDLCWLETPVNPTGESRDIQYYADKIHKVGGKLLVDATFGPPPLQKPFKFGADYILHSATKYFGGHSDLLAGILAVKTKQEWATLVDDRCYLGSTLSSLDSWLLLRSLRTHHLRIPRQSENATKLVEWLAKVAATPAGQEFEGIPGGLVAKVTHSSLQGKDDRGFDPKVQMEGGWNATFSVILLTQAQAKLLPHLLKLFVPATSLGGVESLIEWRGRADAKEDPCLVRISVGVEEAKDLIDDIRGGLQKLASQHPVGAAS